MFINANDFCLFIEKMVHNDSSINYVDAVLKYCDDNSIEPEDIKSLINESLMAKMKLDFIDMKYIKKDSDTTELE